MNPILGFRLLLVLNYWLSLRVDNHRRRSDDDGYRLLFRDHSVRLLVQLECSGADTLCVNLILTLLSIIRFSKCLRSNSLAKNRGIACLEY